MVDPFKGKLYKKEKKAFSVSSMISYESIARRYNHQ